MKKLGVKPVESLIKIHYAWSDGDILSEDIIYIDMEKLQQDIASCYIGAQRIAIELGVIDDETIEPLIQKAHREAMGIIFEMPIIIDELIDEYLKKASINANIVESVIFGESKAVLEKEIKAKPKKKEIEEEKDSEKEATGIGSLF